MFLSIALLAAVLLADPVIKITDRVPPPQITPQVTPGNPAPIEAAAPVRRVYVFGYRGCAPCRTSEPELRAWLATAGLTVKVPTPNSDCVEIDIQEFPVSAAQWKTELYPTVIIHDDLHEVARHVGAYTRADLERLWGAPRSASAHAGHVAAAFASGAGTEIKFPRVSVNPATKAVTILETMDIPYGNFVTATLSQGSVLTIGTDGQCSFSKPYPRIRTSPIHWDGYLRGVKVNTTARTAVLQIDGFPDQTIRY